MRELISKKKKEIMFIPSDLICLKLKSNSGIKLSDNQLVFIADKESLPLEFLVTLRAYNYSKIWFNLESTQINLIAFENGNNEIYLFETSEKVSENLKVQLESIKSLSIPKRDVHVDQNQLNKILHLEQLRELKAVVEPIQIDDEINIEPSIDWKTIVCIEIRKYNQDFLIKISGKLKLQAHYLINLKENNVAKIYWDTSRPYFIGYLIPEDLLHNKSDNYKGLFLWNYVYKSLSKKEKDRLLKMKSIDIKDLIDPIKSNPITKNQMSNVQLNLDEILEKITKYGINSLSVEERNFLDEESKKD